MINFFDFAANDKSIGYLYTIFGSMNGVIENVNNQAQADLNLISVMFGTFNTIILTIGVMIVVYTTIVGVMLTAHEGEFMGKKWNNIWIPIRTVLGVGLLVPTGSGYSGIQIAMMWIVLQGVGAADTLWNTALGYAGTVGARNVIGIPSSGTSATLKLLFQSLVCEKSALRTEPHPLMSGFSDPIPGLNTLPGGYYCSAKPTDPICTRATKLPDFVNSKSIIYMMGPFGACGSLVYCSQKSCDKDPNSLTCGVCKAQRQALSQIVPTLSDLATQFVKADLEYQDYYMASARATAAPTTDSTGTETTTETAPSAPVEKPVPPAWIQAYCDANEITNCYGGDEGGLPKPGIGTPGPPSNVTVPVYWPYAMKPTVGEGDFIKTSVKYYTDLVMTAIRTYIQTQAKDTLTGDLADARDAGWIVAGRYYYTVSQSSNTKFKQSIPSFGIIFMGLPPAAVQNPMFLYRNNYNAAGRLISAISASTATDSSGVDDSASVPVNLGVSDDDATAIVGDNTNSMMSDVGDSFSTGSSGVKDVLFTIQQVGYAMLVGVDVAFAAILYALVQFAIGGFLSAFLAGNGFDNPAGPAAQFMYLVVAPPLMLLFGTLVLYGGLLGVYVPLIPFIIFTFGALGWLIATIEAMVAGPLVALGMLSPSGQHEIMGKAEPAIMLLFGIFLRPSLMIFGLMMAMMLASVAVSMVQTAFWQATPTFSQVTVTGTIIRLSMYVTIIISVINKSFALIYLIPEKVMSWISGHGQNYGESEALGEMKGSMEKATGGVRSQGEARAKGSEDAHKTDMKAKKAKKDKQAADLQGGGGK